jgi:hypothetical protein
MGGCVDKEGPSLNLRPNQVLPILGAASQKGSSGTGLQSVPRDRIAILVDDLSAAIAFSRLLSDEIKKEKKDFAIFKNLDSHGMAEAIQKGFQFPNHKITWNVVNEQSKMGTSPPFVNFCTVCGARVCLVHLNHAVGWLRVPVMNESEFVAILAPG